MDEILNPQTFNTLPSRTEKSHRSKVNINSIMARAHAGVETPTRSGGLYGDFSNVPSYHAALTRVADAKSDFERLPSKIRKRFRNDAAELIAFITDEANRQEAEVLGLIPAAPPVTEELQGSDPEDDTNDSVTP